MAAMIFYDRPDGRRIRALSPFDAILPYVVRKRNEASVLFSRDIDVEAALAYVRRKNAEPAVVDEAAPGTAAGTAAGAAAGTASGAASGERYSLFGLLIAAAVRTIALKPRLNRFVHRRGVYQREGISVSFIVKRDFSEASSEGTVKVGFRPEDRVSSAMERIGRGIEAAKRGDAGGGSADHEYAFAHRVPFGKAAVTGAFRLLDRLNLPPRRMLEADPLFSSIYIANLGSIGLDTPYHHLYEWGSSSLFMVVGRVFQKESRRSAAGAPAGGPAGGPAGAPPSASPRAGPELRHFVNVKFTVDERIAEGLYFAHAVALFQKLVSRPELLEEEPDLSAVEL
jgi:hypothetical protein